MGVLYGKSVTVTVTRMPYPCSRNTFCFERFYAIFMNLFSILIFSIFLFIMFNSRMVVTDLLYTT